MGHTLPNISRRTKINGFGFRGIEQCKEINFDFFNSKILSTFKQANEGFPPRDPNGDPYELHHIGQRQDSPFAELTWAEHMGEGNNVILHPRRESVIDRQQFGHEKSDHWQARFAAFTPRELKQIYNE